MHYLCRRVNNSANGYRFSVHGSTLLCYYLNT
jgi:hypothetical protein